MNLVGLITVDYQRFTNCSHLHGNGAHCVRNKTAANDLAVSTGAYDLYLF